MKRIAVLALLVPLSFASCAPFGLNTVGYVQNHEDLATAWPKSAAVRYEEESGNYWKSPAEVERDGTGDCEDIATYLMYLLGPDSSLLIVRRTGHTYLHAIVKYHGLYLEAQVVSWYYTTGDFEVICELSYDRVMLQATNWGTKFIGGKR